MSAVLVRPGCEDPPVRRAAGRARAAVAAARLAGALSRRTGRGRGSTLPGRVGLRLEPSLLGRLAADRRVVLVSGTNGKSTTTRYLAAALATCGPVLTNGDGANLRSGLVTALLAAPPRDGVPGDERAVLEIDEAVLATSVVELAPRVVVLLNLTRDQLDRTGEVASLVRAWSAALRQAPWAVVVANADDPLVCAAVLMARPDATGVHWVGAGQPWRHDCPLCPVCGAAWTAPGDDWSCAACGFARPSAAWWLVGDSLHVPGGTDVLLRLGLPGRANRANAAMAVAAAACLGVSVAAAVAAMRSVSEVDGRYLQVAHAGGQVRLLLAKNPAGWAEVLAQLADQDGRVVVAVNAHGADGTDTSWLWDVPFEQLRGRDVVASGERSADVALRLRYAGVAHSVDPQALRAASGRPGLRTHVIANYTAFTRVRAQLLGAPATGGRLQQAG